MKSKVKRLGKFEVFVNNGKPLSDREVVTLYETRWENSDLFQLHFIKKKKKHFVFQSQVIRKVE